MQSNAARALIALASVAAVVVLFVVLSGGDGGETTTSATGAGSARASGDGGGATPSKPPPKTIVVKNGQPEGGVQDLTFAHGEEIRFNVSSDTSDEVHVHGYDIGKDVEAGGQVRFDFPADIEGVFEVELEGAGVQIAQLTVKP